MPPPVKESERIFLVVRTRSILACVIHWVLFVAVVVLTVTGFYIADPNYYFGKGEAYQAFAMANMRFYHFIAATFMIVCLIGRFYLAFTRGCNRDIMRFIPTPRNVIQALKLMKFLITLRGPHAHYRFINPLGGVAVFMMSGLMVVQVLTGFLMYLPGADTTTWYWATGSSLERALGGQQNIRLIHHLVMFLIIFMVFIHVYMQIVKNIIFTESDISSIIGGYKAFPVEQIGHFADMYGLHIHDMPPTEAEQHKASTPMIEAVERDKERKGK